MIIKVAIKFPTAVREAVLYRSSSSAVAFGVNEDVKVLVKFDANAPMIGSAVVTTECGGWVVKKRRDILSVSILEGATETKTVEVPEELGGFRFGDKCFRHYEVLKEASR